MKRQLPLHMTPALIPSLQQLAQKLHWRRVLLLGGRRRVVDKLNEMDLDVVWNDPHESNIRVAPTFDAIVAISQIGGVRPTQAHDMVRSWVALLHPGGTLALAELAAEGDTGSLAMKLARRLRGKAFMDPADQCSLLLHAGIRDIHQVWPQGVGSWVLSHGVKAALAHLERVPDAQTAGLDPQTGLPLEHEDA
ncbi:MAG: hypothetical protein J7M25_13255 [Deltaproteobacteria bacterium]|nr:hypothetical protein [Deltaproteobacteria bacterium]